MLPIKIDNDQFRNKSGEIICQLYDQGLRLGSKVHKERLKITLDFFEIDWCESYLKEYLEVYIKLPFTWKSNQKYCFEVY